MTGRVIPFRGPRTLTKFNPGLRNKVLLAKFAGKAARAVYRNRRMYGRQAKKGLSAFQRMKSRKRKIRAELGINSKPTNVKTGQIIQIPTSAINTRQLYTLNLCTVPKDASAAFDIENGRERDLIDLRGVRLHWEWTNQRLAPLRINVAVIVPKENNGPLIGDFFKGETDTRFRGFGTALSSIEFATTPINTDAYAVLSHKRWILEPAGKSSETGFGPEYKSERASYVRKSQYINISRYFGFKGTNPVPSGRHAWLVYWCDFWGNTPGSLATGGATIALEGLSFFKEPSNCC